MKPFAVYEVLLSRFGPQGWWPVAPAGGGAPAYHPERWDAPSETQSLEIVVGAVLTQNTAWANVDKAVRALHQARAMDVKTLLAMPPRRLESLIRPSGYFRQKARRLKVVMRHIQSRGGLNPWFRGELAALREDLLSVSGIGPETADSILLYAASRPSFVVDAYTMRIGGRVGWFSPSLRSGNRNDYATVQEFFLRRLPPSARIYQEMHALIVALAKFFCRTKPLCGACPLAGGCRYRHAHVR